MARSILLLCFIVSPLFAIECYTKCENSGSQCYNMTAAAGGLLDVMKAGCSLWRCMLARDRCISTTFKNIPISLCCCSGERCNVGNAIENGESKQNVGGWNAEPNQEGRRMGTDEPSEDGHLTREEIAEKFGSAELDEDEMASTTRGARLG